MTTITTPTSMLASTDTGLYARFTAARPAVAARLVAGKALRQQLARRRQREEAAMAESPAQTREIKEWKAVMDSVSRWPVKDAAGCSRVQLEARLTETRVIERH